eukprot:311365-Hanusia_phi.AAC.1
MTQSRFLRGPSVAPIPVLPELFLPPPHISVSRMRRGGAACLSPQPSLMRARYVIIYATQRVQELF